MLLVSKANKKNENYNDRLGVYIICKRNQKLIKYS